MKYIQKTENGWREPEEPDKSNDVGRFNSLALDNNGYPHIIYYDYSKGYLKYIHKTINGWTAPLVIDNGGDVGEYVSSAIDRNEYIHAAYYHVSFQNLKYAKYKCEIDMNEDY